MASVPLQQRRSVPGECSYGAVPRPLNRERRGGQRQRRSSALRAWQDRLPGSAGLRFPSVANVADAAGQAATTVGQSLSAPVAFVGTALAQPFARSDSATADVDAVVSKTIKRRRWPRLGLSRGGTAPDSSSDDNEVRLFCSQRARIAARAVAWYNARSQRTVSCVRVLACVSLVKRAPQAAPHCTCGRAPGACR